MAKTIVDIAEFRRRIAKGHKPGVAVRLATDGQASVSATERTVSFVFSDNSVDRYGDTIDARGWVLENFNANPIALFGHDSGSVENVIGRAKNVRIDGNRLIGDIEFMEASVNPNAEAVYQMVKGGFLKTVSVGFQPLEWTATKDKSRPGGVDFRKQELMEISIVPIPANPNALHQAKAAGIDVERLGLQQAAPVISTRGLYEVSWLAQLLAELGYLEDCVEWEAEYEGDTSAVPAMLTDALKQLGSALVAMTIEEVAELLADEDGEPVVISDDVVALAVLSPAQKALVKLVAIGRRARAKRSFVTPVETRAGKVLYTANETTLRDAHGLMTQACDMVIGVAGQNEPDDEDTQTAAAEAEARSRRAREAEALRLRVV